MTGVEVLGLIAGALTTGATFPQVYRSWKTGSARDLSLPMYVLTDVGIACWLVYGILSVDLPVIVANVVALMSVSAILGLKLRYG